MDSLLKSGYYQLNQIVNISIKKFSKNFKNIDAYINTQLEKFGDLNNIVERLTRGYFMFNQLLNQDVVNKLNIEFDFVLKKRIILLKNLIQILFSTDVLKKNNLYFDGLIYMFRYSIIASYLKLLIYYLKKKIGLILNFFQETKKNIKSTSKRTTL